MFWAIFVGTGVLFLTMVVQAVASGATIQVAASLARSGFAGAGFWHNFWAVMLIVLIAFSGIIVQISLWAIVVLKLDKFSDFTSAFYYSASNFTTLGLDSIQLGDQWRLLAPLEAINGVLMFGVTTGMIFTIMARLADLRTRKMIEEGRP